MIQTKLATTPMIRLADVLYIGEAGPENNNESVRRAPKKERVKIYIYTGSKIQDYYFRANMPGREGMPSRCFIQSSMQPHISHIVWVNRVWSSIYFIFMLHFGSPKKDLIEFLKLWDLIPFSLRISETTSKNALTRLLIRTRMSTDTPAELNLGG